MIPNDITRDDLLEAIRVVVRDGIPASRRSRQFCVIHRGRHFAPKYVISKAYEVVTGSPLPSATFSGGAETNRFLSRLGFEIRRCRCGGSGERHSESCSECKRRIRELLARLFGECIEGYSVAWSTDPESYTGTVFSSALNDIFQALQTYRGYDEFVRSEKLRPLDFYVPRPGFAVEFDESQHFTRPRAVALGKYPTAAKLGFSRERWKTLCDSLDRTDNDPPDRDEQRAWYDTLRDLIPLMEGWSPTVRLYARDIRWCSLDPDNQGDLASFRKLLGLSSQTVLRGRTGLKVALVFPEVTESSDHGLPPSTPSAQKPELPIASDFQGELLDLVVFPEAYIRVNDRKRESALARLAADLSAQLLVGAVATSGEQVVLRFQPDGTFATLYTKHSTAGVVAFDDPEWNPETRFPIWEVAGLKVGITLCHDSYLGLFQHYLRRKGAQIWINPSYENVLEEKWASILRLRAVENGFTALCTLHDNRTKRTRTHPFAFGPDGHELRAHCPGETEVSRPLSECTRPGIYVVDTSAPCEEARHDPGLLPHSRKRSRGNPRKSPDIIRLALRGGKAHVWAGGRWSRLLRGEPTEVDGHRIMIEWVSGDELFDPTCFFRFRGAYDKECHPIFWNFWEELPCASDQLVSIMLGRSLESLAPVILSDRQGIHEVVVLANDCKGLRRTRLGGEAEAAVDISRAWGLNNSFKLVTRHIGDRAGGRAALERYASLLP